MTVGPLEALTSAIGDEYTEIGGFRSTRLTTQLTPETRIASGIDSASSVDSGLTVSLSAGTFPVTVVAGQIFRIQSGGLIDETATVASRDSATQVTLVAPGIGANFTNISWEIVERAESVAAVESALDWSASGEVFIDDVRYRYDSRTNTTLVGLRGHRHLGRKGKIFTVPGTDIVHGETFIIDDGHGHIDVFEFDKTGEGSPLYIPVFVDNSMSADAVRDKIIEAVNTYGTVLITASSGGAAIVNLEHDVAGGKGFIHVTDTVSDADFRVDGPRGVERRHEPKASVIDYTRNFTNLDKVKRGTFVETAEGTDLDAVGLNVGVGRPPELDDDSLYSRLIKAIAYAARGTEYTIELALNAVLGIGRWETFEDLTEGSLHHNNTIFLRRIDANELDPNGKAFLDGEELKPIDSTTQVTLSQTPLRIAGVRLADEPARGERIIQESTPTTTASSAGSSGATQTVTGPTASFNSNIRPGDVFIVTTGTIAGARATIQSRDSGEQLTLGPLRGSPDFQIPPRVIDTGSKSASSTNGTVVTLLSGDSFSPQVAAGQVFEILSGLLAGARQTITSRDSDGQITLSGSIGAFTTEKWRIIVPHASFTSLAWRIIRPISNFRHYKPSEEVYQEYLGDVGTTIWEYTGTAAEGTAATLQSNGTEGEFLRVQDDTIGTTASYRHKLRIQPESRASAEIHLLIPSTTNLASGANDGLQIALRLRDGAKEINLGVYESGGLAQFRLVDSAGTAIGSDFIDLSLDTYHTLRIEKDNKEIRLLANGSIFATVSRRGTAILYNALPNSSNTELEWGCFSTTLGSTVEVHVKTADWSCETPTDFWNVQRTAGELGGAPSRVLRDTTGTPFVASDATVPRRVRIRDFTVLSAAEGTPVGEWEVEATNASDEVTLVGYTQRGALFDAAFPNRIVVRGGLFAFRSPDHRGHKIVIESGPNAGTYTISKFLNPVDFSDLEASFLQTLPNQTDYVGEDKDAPLRIWTNAIEVSDAPIAGFTTSTQEVNWHLEPVFAADVGPIPYEIVDGGSSAGAVLTLRQALPIGIGGGYIPLVKVHYTTVRAAQVLDETDVNNEPTPGTFDFYPFYLSDNWGFLRDVIDAITAAGVKADFDHFFRDASGPHIIDD